MSMDSEIIWSHKKEKHGTTTVKDYCTAMSNDAVWVTDIKILDLATTYIAPINTLSCENLNLYSITSR